METRHMIVFGEHAAKHVATRLVNESQWFQMQPLPLDQWEFAVKVENANLLRNLINEAQSTPELLEALELALGLIEAECPEALYEKRIARQAIAKAKGK